MGEYLSESQNALASSSQGTCYLVEGANGYFCQTELIYVLEFESIDNYKEKTKNWPVTLAAANNDNVLWSTVLNGFKEWSSRTRERLNRYASLIVANQTYEVRFSRPTPKDMVFQLQQKSE